MPSADSLIIFVCCSTIQLHHIHHPAIPSYCSPSLRNLLHAILLLPFPPSCTFISFSYLPPMCSLCCQRSVYLISISLIRATLHDFLQRNCLRSLSSSTFFLFFFPSLFDFLFYILSLFNISHQHSAFSLSSSCFMPPWGDHVAG